MKDYSPTTTTTKTMKTTGNVYMRNGAGITYGAILVIPKGKTVTVKSSKKASNGKLWYYVTYNGKTGYVSSAYLK